MHKFWLQLAIAAALLGVIIASLVVAAANVSPLRVAALAECERVQILRDQDNQVAEVAHDVLQRSALQILRAHPPAQERLVAETYLRFSRRLTFTPATDCARAVGNPGGYRAPRPKHFSDLH